MGPANINFIILSANQKKHNKNQTSVCRWYVYFYLGHPHQGSLQAVLMTEHSIIFVWVLSLQGRTCLKVLMFSRACRLWPQARDGKKESNNTYAFRPV